MKKVSFGGKPPVGAGAANADAWVTDRKPSEQEPTKRFTINVPLSLHRRVKSQCALENLVMAEVMRELLEERFPATIAGEGHREHGKS